MHRQIRKVTKSKVQWPHDKALTIQIFLILQYGKGGQKKKEFNWVKIARELKEVFVDRYTKHLK